MDFESYIAMERQLIARLDRERNDSNSYERRAEVCDCHGLTEEDGIRLPKTGERVTYGSDTADAISAIDEHLADLHRVEAEINAMNADFIKRVSDFESRFDQRYNEIMDRINLEFAALEARNTELNAASMTSTEEVRKISESAIEDLRRISEDLKMAQAVFDASVNDKLSRDQETIERIRYIMKQMNDMIKS